MKISNFKKVGSHAIALVLVMALAISCFSGSAFAAGKSDDVKTKISNLAILNLANDSNALLSEYREPVVMARHLFNSLDKTEQAALISDGTLKKLQTAEAKVLNLWIRDTPLNSVVDGGVTGVMEEQYNALAESLGDAAMKSLVPNYSRVKNYNDNLISTFQAEKRENYKAAMKVEAVINHMQVLALSDKPEAVKARAAYDALTSNQQAFVTNYNLLKDAENKIAKWEGKTLPHQDAKNVVYAGARSSSYGPGTPWLSKEDWKSVADDMTSYFPNAQPTLLWIIGALHDEGCNLEFAQPNDGVDYSSKKITFGQPTTAGHLSHEDYFNYFDEHGIKVYLQVEAGYADMETLMDLIFKEYGHHKCIAGFGVDVEWYYGVEEDSGLPVTDELAKEWETHLKGINPNYRMFLKHYNARYLPPTYRGVNNDILFCDDSQSFGSMNGDALGQYDTNVDDVLGFIPEFKKFSECFPDNEVIYQIGYRPDAMWYDTLENPVIKSLGTRLAEVTKQNCGIAWVDFTLKDPLTFPQVMKDGDMAKALKTRADYLNPNGEDNMIGKRFAANKASYRDAMYVARLRSLIDKLTKNERGKLNQKSLTYLTDVEAKAIDIRIKNLPAELRKKDKDTVIGIRKAYSSLSSEQQKRVTKLAALKAAEKQITVKCDTELPFKVKAGAAYTFKITAESKPILSAGTQSVFKIRFVKAVGKDYFFKATAVGKAGTACGFYINSQKTPVTVATILK